MSDDRQDFVPIEPTPAVAQPVAPPPPPGYYNPPAPPPQYAPSPPPQYAPEQPTAGPTYGNYPANQYPAQYPGQYPGQYPNQYATYAAPAQPSGLAIASMILGIVGVLFSFFYGFGLFPAIAAIITGHIARKKQPHARGFWLAGLITGYVGLGLCLLVIIGIVALFAFIGTTNFNGSTSSGF
ncbi:MAG: hypothetical protein QOK08_2182 [Actinomycetota bacterium]|nr:hypothetical protein [Actinomycetota bacterium]